MWRSSYKALNSKGEILHDQAGFRGKAEMHYHQFFSTACYVQEAIPAVVYLAMKYHGDVEKGLEVNTNLGGENAGRGEDLGALLGAANGAESIPRRWIDGLVAPPPELEVRSRTQADAANDFSLEPSQAP